MLELIKVQVESKIVSIGVRNGKIYIMDSESVDEIKKIYKKLTNVEVPKQIDPFSFQDFLAYAKEHDVLKKIDWKSFFGVSENGKKI